MSNPQPTPAKTQRRKALLTLAGVVAIGAIAFGLYDWLVASHEEYTDNAYVQGNVIQITPQTGGTVMSIFADDTDLVRAGSPLVQLDPADARVALQQAEANLAQTVRQVRQLYTNNAALAAQVRLREAEVARAQADITRAQEDLRRRQQLTGDGAVSQEELQHTQSQLATARTQLAAAQA
ncbi:MAG TPA: biotin/lipoyl-binding protein, partial [Alicycliphilus sp.]|nr:biotin/lipoyl-binding protein [Alicycliphilus sp.]